jgi:predicted dithiol-disulfide oxidoreductase (DUF899 family)
MVEVDAAIPVTGEHGPVPLLDVFEGRRQLIVYYHMWHAGQRTLRGANLFFAADPEA